MEPYDDAAGAASALDDLLARARECERRGDLAGADRLIGSAPSALRAFGTYHYAAGAIAFRLGKLEEALAEFEQAVALEPEVAEFQGNLGAALVEKARRSGSVSTSPELKRACAVLESAVRLSPRLPGAYVNLGVALLASGEPERASAAFSSALQLDPRDIAALYNKAAALAACGRPEDSLVTLDRLLEVSPGFAPARESRRNLLRRLGRAGGED